ncbi:META domain-containing protein [Carboxylicivirga sp. N1Y90]|uniref:META domain-containing protein n=1 Tax=Carboxylicivirga fragile TaxID=3417571 RepID=UPI003D352939|nr:META domain-containing protein [Marinilabiliaceae bacterium N1Y90]
MKNYFFAILSISLLISCASTKETNSQKKANTQVEKASIMLIENNQWELLTFNGKAAKEAGFVNTTPHITINKEKGSIGGNSGCNSFGGNAKVGESSITFGMFMSTKMYCDGVPETEFFKLLEGDVDYRIIGNKLLLSKEGKVFMEFQLKEK